MWCKQGGGMYRHGVWSKATTPGCYGHTYALAFHPYVLCHRVTLIP